ncbi:DUF1192 domain-containing protein [Brevundimonas sp. SL130]|jgi:uncharacterized small protein (DUF1192 family)|uniref:DUF1192 domain-containing protein n=1 Tax=Brevundimonas sp. SL130 TaxID=2995143 RepID=UPI00226C64D6|nr:DUF1192 domain-containing protein [Brevundimonas sp. SL130]WAC61084.1 DUF1192 domain-containing protein [Brevundimonas sp. SL130]
MFEDLEPRSRRGDALTALGREDLDAYSIEDLQERIQALDDEIGRARAAIDAKTAKKSAADALFNFRS